MENKWKKAAAFAMSLALVAVNSAGSLSNSNMIVAKAAEATVESSETAGTVSKQGEDESYYDAETETLHLKGYVRNGDNHTGLIYPDGIDGAVMHIVADEGTVLPVDSSFLFYEKSIETIDLKNADTSNVTDMSHMFAGMLKIKYLDLSGCDTSNVTNMSGMFSSWWHSADYINISGLDTSKVTDMSDMFTFNDVGPFDLTIFDTSNVTDMSNMFGWSGADVLDLSSFDTSKVTDMSDMFYVANPKTIYVGPGWTTESAIGADMFGECYDIVGGAGTVYDPNQTGIEYAHVDGGSENPGYLTFKDPQKDESYFDAETGTLHLKGYVRNGGEETGLALPEGVEGIDVINIVADEGTVLPEDCRWLLLGLDSVETIDLKNADSSNVTDMSYMFGNTNLYLALYEEDYLPYSHIKSIDLIGMDTSNVTDMSYMFAGCLELESLDLSSFDTSNVQSMKYMFLIDAALKSLDLSSFDTSYVSDMSNMFDLCFGLEHIDIKSFNTMYVNDFSGMFNGCRSLTSLDISNFDTRWAKDMNRMFTGCEELSDIDLSSFVTRQVTDMSYMFCNCDKLKSLDISNFDTAYVTDMSNMFGGCNSLETIIVGNGWSTESVEEASYMFYRCEKLKGGEGTVYDEKHIDIEYAHVDGANDNPGYFTPMDTNGDETYYDAETETLHLKGNVRNSTNGTGIIYPDVINGDIKHIVADEGTVLPVDSNHLFSHTSAETIDLKNADTSNVTDMSYMFEWGYSIQAIDFTNFDTSKVTNMAGMFSNWYHTTPPIDISGFDTSNVTNMSGMFSACTAESFDFSHLDTSSVTNMSGMFMWGGYDSLDLNNFDTSNVTDMSNMFGWNYGIETIDISSFDTSNVTNMDSMFAACGRLTTVYVGPNWTTENVVLTPWFPMFTDCESLIGGEGTKISSDHDIDYAHADGGKENPGYFTLKENNKDKSYFDAETGTLHLKGEIRGAGYDKGLVLPAGVDRNKVNHIIAEEGTVLPEDCSYFCIRIPNLETIDLHNADTSNVTDMSYMFMPVDDENYDMKEINISNFDTSKVTNMKGMFKWCTMAKAPDFSSFDTSNVTDMSEMFAYSTMIRELDLSSFDTSNVTDMSGMFAKCILLESIDVSSFNTSKVTDMSEMFMLTPVEYLDLSGFDTINVTDMSNMFCGSHIRSIDTNGFDTRNVTNMQGMFFNSCIESIDVSKFDTSNVTDMSDMFDACGRLELLDMSSFDTSNVKNMAGMFAGCNSLEKITVGDGWSTESLEESACMFSGCEKLKGGAGTVYDENHTDAEYARIDGGKSAPGYFTSVNGNSEEDTTIVIVIPEETMNVISYLYDSISDPTIKNIASTAKNFLSKYFSFRII
ncbi:MAG: BspA family leucine-rich repeat surface protein [Ruminococcus sp.]|uniref:BspA family leucine-rich repeat surface protein n=1 Tax=Ruminococcus sp. TaxID=41978 RepID=UPI0025FEDA78|nr:BspA family leucine-rich repeat surface protein [Ruminococcus sp.]MBR5684285.1 BspA family leucine-rich repeat surface protein [Ruminococcus sp.]